MDCHNAPPASTTPSLITPASTIRRHRIRRRYQHFVLTAGALVLSLSPAVAHPSDGPLFSYGSCQYIVTSRSGKTTTGQLIAVFVAPQAAGSDLTGTCDIRDGNGTVIYYDSRKCDPDVGVWFFGRQLGLRLHDDHDLTDDPVGPPQSRPCGRGGSTWAAA